MTRHDPQRAAPDLESLFHEALEHPPAERDALLRARCAEHPALAAELRSLLAAHDAAPADLDAPAWALGERFDALFAHADAGGLEAARPGTRVGAYEVRRRLGQGGMGAVYLAEQHEPFRRLVALKLIKPGMDTREVVRRFTSERQALARLNHPGIAAVHDAGVTEQGRPYFVMEYVPGQRLTDFCDRRALDQRARVELLVSVCRAVHHAHLHGIVHRDLKPGNVLVREVDGAPLPKIIDFGVAKAMVGRRGVSTLATRQGQVLGTPGYMSPEQAGAVEAPVDARSDVYSLGALLHELLTGVLPHERKRLHGASLVTRLRETPPPASARVAGLGRRARRLARRRGLSPRQLVRVLRGDLDAILARALAPEPADRYPSVDALRADLGAWLAGRAVSAPRVRRLAALAPPPALRAAGALLLAAGAGACALWWPGVLDGAGADGRAGARAAPDVAWPASAAPALGHAPLPAAAPCADDAFAGLDAGSAARRLLVRHAGELPLAPGSVLQLVGRDRWQGHDVLAVRAARRDDPAPLAGVLLAAVAPAEHAHASPGAAHLHLAEGALEPGGAGLLLGAGSLAEALVDVPASGLRRGQPLGLSALPGRLAPHATGPVLGDAAAAHGPGPARVDVWVAPRAAPPEPQAAQVAFLDAVPRGAAGAEASRGSQPAPRGVRSSSLAQGEGGAADAVAQAAGPQPQPLALPSLALPSPGAPAHHGAGTEAHPSDPHAPEPHAPEGDAPSHDDPAMAMPQTPHPSQGAEHGDTSLQSNTSGGDHGTPPGTGGELPPREKPLPMGVADWIDLQGDGLLDLVWHPAEGAPQLHVQLAPGRFEERSDVGNFQQAWGSAAARPLDVDGDRRADVVAIARDGRLVLWEGLGDGDFVDGTRARGLADVTARELQVLDVDADGRPDLLVLQPRGGRLVLRNRDGVFEREVLAEPAPAPPAGPAPRAMGALPGGAHGDR